MYVRKTLTTTRVRRCSAAAVASAAAALLLTPSAAFAAGHPVGGAERPAGAGASVGAPADSGHATPHAGRHSTANHPGHRTGRKPGHPTGHPTASVRAGAHKHKAIADDTGTDPTPSSDHTKPNSGSSTDKRPKSTTPKSPKPGSGKSSESGPMATVTKLSMSRTLTSSHPVTMSARVSLAHRAPGAPKESGTVTFAVDGASSGPIPMTNNRAAVKVKLTPGKHTATAKYSGDKSHSPSASGPLNFTVS